jgi:hypothetical protein
MSRWLQIIHLISILGLCLNLSLVLKAGTALRCGLLFVLCLCYAITLIIILVNKKKIYQNAKRKIKSQTLFLLSLPLAFVLELGSTLLLILFVFGLIFKTAGAVKARGEGYEIRSQAGLNWPEYYSLLQITPFTEKQVGFVSLQTYNIKGHIKSVTTGDSIIVRLINTDRDSVCIFHTN